MAMKVTVYSTSTCPYCVMLKKWLDDKGVTYTDYNVGQNPYAAALLVQQSGQRGVPFLTVERNGETASVLGFDQKQLATIFA